ncbi:MAG: acyl-ACP--UDP-N-acetylglucosamine O-acyltransferase [bacterium]
MNNLHATAVVDSKARLGADVIVGPYSIIERDVEIGDGCVIGPHVVLRRYTTLGPACRVHAGAVLGEPAQDLGFKEVPTYVRIGRGCTIREGVTIHRATQPEMATEVGDGVFLMVQSHIAHDAHVGAHTIIANATLLGGHVHIGERAFLSAHVLVHQFVRIGRLAMVAGASGISQDVPPFCTTRPMTVNTLLGVNRIGIKRAGLTVVERNEIKRAFELLYRSDLNAVQAVARIRGELSAGPAGELADFVAASRRGCCQLRADRASPTTDTAEF